MDVSKAIVAKSDQMNAIDLVGGDITVTILDTKKGPDDQPVHIITDAYGPSRPFKPSKTVLRDIVQGWGLESNAWVGKRLTLFCDPTVTWAGAEVGGIRVRAMSDIPKAFPSTHILSRTKTKKVTIQPLPDAVPTRDWLAELTLAADNLDAITTLGTAARTANAGEHIIKAILAEHGRVKAAGQVGA